MLTDVSSLNFSLSLSLSGGCGVPHHAKASQSFHEAHWNNQQGETERCRSRSVFSFVCAVRINETNLSALPRSFVVKNSEFLQQAALEEYGPDLHVALRSRRDELLYLRKLTEMLFPYILPPKATDCRWHSPVFSRGAALPLFICLSRKHHAISGHLPVLTPNSSRLGSFLTLLFSYFPLLYLFAPLRSLTLLIREVLAGSVFLPSMDYLADPVSVDALRAIFFFTQSLLLTQSETIFDLYVCLLCTVNVQSDFLFTYWLLFFFCSRTQWIICFWYLSTTPP